MSARLHFMSNYIKLIYSQNVFLHEMQFLIWHQVTKCKVRQCQPEPRHATSVAYQTAWHCQCHPSSLPPAKRPIPVALTSNCIWKCNKKRPLGCSSTLVAAPPLQLFIHHSDSQLYFNARLPSVEYCAQLTPSYTQSQSPTALYPFSILLSSSAINQEYTCNQQY